MKLALYFARIYAGVLVLMQLGLVIVVLATTFVENADNLTRSQDSGTAVLKLALFGAVQFAYQVFPIAAFLGLLVTGTLLARSGELLAVQAAGVSTKHVGTAFFSVTALATLLSALAAEYLVPEVTAGLDRLQREELGRSGDALTQFYTRRAQYFRDGDLLLYLPAFDSDTQSFAPVVAYKFVKGLITKVIDGERLAFDGRVWRVQKARVYDVQSSSTSRVDELEIALRISPRDLIDSAGDPRVMPRGQVGELIDRRQKAGFDATAHRLELHGRLAFPLSALAMFVLGVPWALNPSRRRSLAVNLGAGVVAVGAILSLTQVFRLLGLARRVPPSLGAWGIDVICVLLVPVSVAAYQRYRTRGSLW